MIIMRLKILAVAAPAVERVEVSVVVGLSLLLLLICCYTLLLTEQAGMQ